MIEQIGRRLAAGSTAVALGGLGVIVAQSPAYATDFSLAYTCTAPAMGTQNVKINGSLTATPNPAKAKKPVAIAVHVAEISLMSPVVINSWSMDLDLDVSGAETAQFVVTGSGGRVPANTPLSGDLAGSWTPTKVGIDEIQGGDATLEAKVPILGIITVACTPDQPRPAGATLTVN
jgi:hypothetical protein